MYLYTRNTNRIHTQPIPAPQTNHKPKQNPQAIQCEAEAVINILWTYVMEK